MVSAHDLDDLGAITVDSSDDDLNVTRPIRDNALTHHARMSFSFC